MRIGRPSYATKARQRVQAYVEGELLEKFRRYRTENELTESAAVRLLLEAGLSFQEGLRADMRKLAIREGLKMGQSKFFEILERSVKQAST